MLHARPPRKPSWRNAASRTARTPTDNQEVSPDAFHYRGAHLSRFLRDGNDCIFAGESTGRSTLLISGGTGAGKTTLLNVLATFIPDEGRIVVIEDTAQLRLAKPNILAAECQTESVNARLELNILLKGALRWRPDRIILGEVPGEEARTLLDSFNTDHGGSMATIHANSPVKALRRFAELALRAHQQATRDALAAEIGDSVCYAIQVRRYSSGRKVSEIAHIDGYDRASKTYDIEPVYMLDERPSPIHRQ